jgi:hypothetical protein
VLAQKGCNSATPSARLTSRPPAAWHQAGGARDDEQHTNRVEQVGWQAPPHPGGTGELNLAHRRDFRMVGLGRSLPASDPSGSAGGRTLLAAAVSVETTWFFDVAEEREIEWAVRSLPLPRSVPCRASF